MSSDGFHMRNRKLGESLSWVLDVLQADPVEQSPDQKRRPEALQALAYVRDILLDSDSHELDENRLFDVHAMGQRNEALAARRSPEPKDVTSPAPDIQERLTSESRTVVPSLSVPPPLSGDISRRSPKGFPHSQPPSSSHLPATSLPRQSFSSPPLRLSPFSGPKQPPGSATLRQPSPNPKSPEIQPNKSTPRLAKQPQPVPMHDPLGALR